MWPSRPGRTERERVVDRLRAAYEEGRLDRPAFEERVARVGSARTRRELNMLLDGLCRAEDETDRSVGTLPGRVRARVGDWLYRALKRAVFCWLPPGHD